MIQRHAKWRPNPEDLPLYYFVSPCCRQRRREGLPWQSGGPEDAVHCERRRRRAPPTVRRRRRLQQDPDSSLHGCAVRPAPEGRPGWKRHVSATDWFDLQCSTFQGRRCAAAAAAAGRVSRTSRTECQQLSAQFRHIYKLLERNRWNVTIMKTMSSDTTQQLAYLSLRHCLHGL